MAYSRDNYKQKKVDKIIDDLNNKLQDFRNNDEEYKKFLDTTSKFHKYSINNIMLIANQRPDATAVAGYKAWKNKFDRQVQKGSKGINIIAPIMKKKNVEFQDSNGETKRDELGKPITQRKSVITGYRAHSVFDINDTKGKPLVTAKDLIKTEFENSNDYKDVYNEFKKHINQKDNMNVYEDRNEDNPTLSTGAKGYYSPQNNEIVISKDMSFDMKFKTLIHEYAHSQLHNDINSQNLTQEERSLKEIEAESSAYIVSNYFDLDTTDYSIGYLSGWSKNISDEDLKNHIKNVHKFSQNTIDEINSMPEFSRYIDNKLENATSRNQQNDLSKMIDTNLKNGFDKVSIIKSNLENKFNMHQTSNNQYENDNFEVLINYDGFNTNNSEDKCEISLKNKYDESLNENFNFSQTYSRNVINNTSTIFVHDNNQDEKKIYKQDNRDIEGNLLKEKPNMNHSDEIVAFENFINNSIEEKGIMETLNQFVSNGYSMGYDLKLNNMHETNEMFINMTKNEDKAKNPSIMSAKIEHDSDDNAYIDFKIKNSAGLKNLSFMESAENINKEQHQKQEVENSEEIDM